MPLLRPRGALRRDLRLSLGDGLAYGVMAGAGEAYLPAFALAAGMPPVLAGLVATVPLFAGGILQMAAPRAIAKAPTLRRWVVGCAVLQALAFVPLVIVAITGRWATPVVFAAASIYWAAGMGVTAGWSSWMCRMLPARLRGRFLGRRQGVAQTSLVASLIGAGIVLQASGGHTAAYAVLFGMAGAARLASALLLSRHGPDIDARPRGRVRLRSIPPRVRGTPRGALIAYLVAALAAAAFAGPFLTPYLLREEGLAYGEYTAFLAAVAIAKIVALPIFGRNVSRIGARRLLTICSFAIAPLPLLWPVSSSMYWLLAVQLFGGAAWAGFDVGMLMTLFDVDDENERTTLQVAFSAMQAVGTAAASIAGGALFASAGSDHDAYLIVFFTSAALRFAAVVLLVRHLPRLLFELPQQIVQRAWVMAIRPWGGTILRPFVEGIDRLMRKDDDDER
jgi:hypothetical protein